MLPVREADNGALGEASMHSRHSSNVQRSPLRPVLFTAADAEAGAENIGTPSAAPGSAAKNRVLAARMRAATVPDGPSDEFPVFPATAPRMSVPAAHISVGKATGVEELDDTSAPGPCENPAKDCEHALKFAQLQKPEDWTQEARMIVTVRRLALHHPEVLEKHLATFQRPLLRAAVSERSRLQVYTLYCFKDLFSQPALTRALTGLRRLDATAKILLACSARPGSQFLAKAAKEAIHALCLCTRCKLLEAFSEACDPKTSTATNATRHNAAVSIITCLEVAKSDEITEKAFASLCVAAVNLSNDKISETRQLARRVVELLSRVANPTYYGKVLTLIGYDMAEAFKQLALTVAATTPAPGARLSSAAPSPAVAPMQLPQHVSAAPVLVLAPASVLAPAAEEESVAPVAVAAEAEAVPQDAEEPTEAPAKAILSVPVLMPAAADPVDDLPALPVPTDAPAEAETHASAGQHLSASAAPVVEAETTADLLTLPPAPALVDNTDGADYDEEEAESSGADSHDSVLPAPRGLTINTAAANEADDDRACALVSPCAAAAAAAAATTTAAAITVPADSADDSRASAASTGSNGFKPILAPAQLPFSPPNWAAVGHRRGSLLYNPYEIDETRANNNSRPSSGDGARAGDSEDGCLSPVLGAPTPIAAAAAAAAAADAAADAAAAADATAGPALSASHSYQASAVADPASADAAAGSATDSVDMSHLNISSSLARLPAAGEASFSAASFDSSPVRHAAGWQHERPVASLDAAADGADDADMTFAPTAGSAGGSLMAAARMQGQTPTTPTAVATPAASMSHTPAVPLSGPASVAAPVAASIGAPMCAAVATGSRGATSTPAVRTVVVPAVGPVAGPARAVLASAVAPAVALSATGSARPGLTSRVKAVAEMAALAAQSAFAHDASLSTSSTVASTSVAACSHAPTRTASAGLRTPAPAPPPEPELMTSSPNSFAVAFTSVHAPPKPAFTRAPVQASAPAPSPTAGPVTAAVAAAAAAAAATTASAGSAADMSARPRPKRLSGEMSESSSGVADLSTASDASASSPAASASDGAEADNADADAPAGSPPVLQHAATLPPASAVGDGTAAPSSLPVGALEEITAQLKRAKHDGTRSCISSVFGLPTKPSPRKRHGHAAGERTAASPSTASQNLIHLLPPSAAAGPNVFTTYIAGTSGLEPESPLALLSAHAATRAPVSALAPAPAAAQAGVRPTSLPGSGAAAIVSLPADVLRATASFDGVIGPHVALQQETVVARLLSLFEALTRAPGVDPAVFSSYLRVHADLMRVLGQSTGHLTTQLEQAMRECSALTKVIAGATGCAAEDA